jgi:hypothetical protein
MLEGILVTSLVNQVQRIDKFTLSAASAMRVMIDVSTDLASKHLLPPYFVLAVVTSLQRDS